MRTTLCILTLLASPLVAQESSTLHIAPPSHNSTFILNDVASKYDAPAEYRNYWKKTLECFNISKPKVQLNKIKWYVVKGRYFRIHGFHQKGEMAGITIFHAKEVYMSEDLLRHRTAVMHEMYHMATGDPGHPVEDFKRCDIPIVFFK